MNKRLVFILAVVLVCLTGLVGYFYFSVPAPQIEQEVQPKIQVAPKTTDFTERPSERRPSRRQSMATTEAKVPGNIPVDRPAMEVNSSIIARRDDLMTKWKAAYPDLFKSHPEIEEFIKDPARRDELFKLLKAYLPQQGLDIIAYIVSQDYMCVYKLADAIPEIDQMTDNLTRLLDSPDAEMREGVCWIFWRLNDRATVPALTKMLADQSAGVRRAAVVALSNLAAPESKQLVADLLSDSNADVRAAAVQFFAQREIKTPEVIPQITNLLSDPDPAVRWAAAFALYNQAGKGSILKLIKGLSDSDAEVRNFTAQIFQSYLNEGNPIPTEAIEPLVNLIADPETVGMIWSIITKYQVKEAVPKLISLLSSTDEQACNDAAQMLIELGIDKSQAETAIPEITGLLSHDNPRVRLNVLYVLSELKAESAVPKITLLLGDPDAEVRKQADLALAHLQVNIRLPYLLDLLNTSDKGSRQSALYALAALGDKDAIPRIMEIMDDPDVAGSAIYALASLQAKESIPQLMRLLSENKHASSVIYALGKLQAQESVPKLLELLDNPDNGYYAISALAELQVKEAIPKIISFLAHSAPHYREGAVMALGKLKAKEAIPEINKLLSDKLPFVREAAEQTLKELDVK